MNGIDPALMRLTAANRYVHTAVRAVAAGSRVPEPPVGCEWLDRAGQHGVQSIIASELQPDGDEPLRAIRLRRAARHLRTLADLRFVQDVLDDAGVDWLVFKGPVLSEVVYQRPGGRDCGDLDVLVRPADLHRAVEALVRRGARCLRPDLRDMIARGDGECEYELPHGTQLDLHWDVVNDGAVRPSFAVSVPELFAAARRVPIGELTIATFGPVDTVVHVALHGCRSGGDRLRWLLDLQQSLLRCAASPVELHERARRFGLELVLRCMLNRQAIFVGTRGLPALPPPATAHRLWLAADRAMMRRFPPGSRYEGKLSGAIMTDSTRRSATQSWVALVGRLPKAVAGRRSVAVAADATAR